MIQIKSERIFNIMNVVSWIVFIGYCIKAGAITTVSIISLFGNKRATENLYMGLDLSTLYDFSSTHYTIVVILLILITGLKAYLFYLLISIFKTMNFKKPFNKVVVNLVFKICYLALSIGIIGIAFNAYIIGLQVKVMFTQLDINTSAYIFMAGVIFIVATLFKRATEIQQENELTI
ncbi:DUF2975 domain-containing protein [Psychroserpens burtonensis]|uniref:DUF2975 domain-containing protein n=1 Tax=Psychroserpens burtonensis TaxID=49278 RepID=A0A5C7B977_9FLAO|nr:DUF2975 domain-containing protein [Psychroserpens burtonensis]TXE17816.1 DUF2975 domain-containing protein [Psychroserpens burtonensis]